MARHRRIVVAAICAFCAAVILVGHFFPSLPFLSGIWQQEQNFEDFLQREGRKARTHPEFVFLGIDQTTLELPPFSAEELASSRALQLMTERPYPWSREVWALLLDRLFGAGARGVMFDFVSNPPNDGDPVFHDALDRYRDRVVIGMNFDMSKGVQAVVPNASLIPPPALLDERVGFVIFFSDPLDRKVRSVRYMMSDRTLAGLDPHPSQEVYYSMSARMLKKIGHEADVSWDFLPHQFRFGANDAYLPVPLYEVFDPKLWHANYADGAFFKDKIVVVGASAQIAHDFVPTPMSPDTPGPTLHIHAMAATLDHDFLHPTSERTDLILVAAAAVLAWLLISFVRRPLVCVISLLAITGAYLAFARVSYDRIGLLVVVVPVVSAFLTAGFLSLGFEFVLERMEKLRTRRTLERYVSKNLVKEILDNPDSFYSSLRGVRLPATILFSDIVGFTTLTESADPEKLVAQLNEYLSQMTGAVFENNGTLDKFIGDAVMAVWGNVSSRGLGEDAKACARAALDMRRELAALNQQWAAQDIPPFHIGIGINHGDVLVGNIGSQEKADPTVIGDAVNLASRLEALTRTYAGRYSGRRAGGRIDPGRIRSAQRGARPGERQNRAGGDLHLDRREEGSAGRGISPPPRDLRGWLPKISRARFHPGEDSLFRSSSSSIRTMPWRRCISIGRSNMKKQPPDAAWNAVEVFKKK